MEALKGLITAPNTLQTDPYSVITADNVVVDIGGYLRTREGQKQIAELPVNSRISTIVNNGSDNFYFLENGSIYRNSGLAGSNYVIPDLKIGVQASSVGNMVYANVVESTYKTQQQLGGGIKIGFNIQKQGVPRPVIASIQRGTIYTDYDDWATTNSNEVRYNSTTPAYSSVLSLQLFSCAYCCTIEYTDENGRLIESEPSNVVTRTFYNVWNSNSTTPDSNVVGALFNQLKIYCYDINLENTQIEYKLNIYRTEIFSTNSSFYNWVSLDYAYLLPTSILNDRVFYLIDTIDKSQFVSATTGPMLFSKYFVYLDKIKSNSFAKRPLYSNSDATQQNANSPIHKVFSKFKEFFIYANTKNKKTMKFNTVVPWTKGTSYSTPQVSDIFYIDGYAYNMNISIINYNVDGFIISGSSYFVGNPKVYSANLNIRATCNTYNENGFVSNLNNIVYKTSTQYTDTSLFNSLMFNNPNGGFIPFVSNQSFIIECKNFDDNLIQDIRADSETFIQNGRTGIGLKNIFDRIEYKNRLYYSKFQEPDSIPRLNYLDVGDGSEILGVKQLRQSLFIFKENDGVYILRGNTPDDWSLLRLYPDLRLVAPRTLVVMEDAIIGLFNIGIVAVSENGFEILSKNIKDIIEPLTRSNTPERQWAVDDKTNRRYYAFIDVGTNGSKPYVFDFYTESWTRHTYERNAGVYANGKLITTLLEDGVNKIYEQETAKYVDTNLLGVETKITSTIEFRKFTGDASVFSKVFKDILLFFRTNNFTNIKVSFQTNLTNSYYTYSVGLIKNLTYVLGNVIRSLVPRGYSRGNWLSVKIETDPATAVVDKTKPEFALEGIEVFFNKTSSKT